MGQNQKLTLVGLLLLIIGFLSGWLGFLLFGDIAGSTRVLFVSNEAVIKAEEERIKAKTGDEATMFFGKKSEEVLGKIENIAKAFENRRTKILFVSSNSGKALGGVGVSELVHRELMKELKEK